MVCRWIGGWTGVFLLNTLIAGTILIFGVGFGMYTAVKGFIAEIHSVGIFPKCYQC